MKINFINYNIVSIEKSVIFVVNKKYNVMILTIFTLVATIIMFVFGRLRADIVALCSLSVLILGGVLTPSEALAGFSNPVIIMMAGLFVVGGAILQTGLAKTISHRIMRMAGNNDTRMFLMVVLVTAVIGAFVSNTGTVALMMPIIVAMAKEAKKSASLFLMPLAFASSMGGMLTLIGTPPNLVIDETLRENGYDGLSFFSFLPIGIVCLAVGIIVMLPLSKLFLNKKAATADDEGKSLDDLVEEYHIADDIVVYRVCSSSTFVGKTIAQLNLRARYGISIMEIRRETSRRGRLVKNVKQDVPTAETIIQAEDILYLQGDSNIISQYATRAGLRQMHKRTLDFYDIGMVELVVMPESRLIGISLQQSRMRESYNVNVVGVKRSAEYVTSELQDIRLRAGDILLVQGRWDSLSAMEKEERDWLLLDRPKELAENVTLSYKAPLAAAIMLLMVLAMVFDYIPVAPVTAVIVAGLLMVVSGCFRSVDAAYKTINWESIVLIAAMMPMATALEKTGVSSMVSHSLVRMLGDASPVVLLCSMYFTTSLLTMFISNTATAVLMAPIAMSAAVELGVNSLPLLFSVTLGASMCFASPFSTPPNALVMHAGNYTFGDYVKVGLPLQIIMGLVMTVVLAFMYPL